MTGLAQKGGAVVSHVRIADTPERHPRGAHRRRRGRPRARLRHGTGVSDEALAKMQKGVTRALVNTAW